MKTIKAELKQLVLEIKALKTRLGTDHRLLSSPSAGSSQSDLGCKRAEFRHKHIAYCLVRGRTLEQIEGNAKRPRNDRWIERLVEQYKLLLPKPMTTEEAAYEASKKFLVSNG